MKITVLVDNRARPGLASEHGLSLWIETPAGDVLFDTGQGPAFESNVRALGTPLQNARTIVLSHGHYDHTGGLPYALESNTHAPIFVHPAIMQPRFSLRDKIAKPIGMPAPAQRALQAAGTRVQWVSGPVEILPGVHVTGPIPRRTAFEDTGGPFFLNEQGLQPDGLPDDQALWMDTPRGLVVLLGCAHSGVVNTLNEVCERAGRERVYAVMGGMHLAAASPARLEETARALVRRQVRVIVPCHCTGDAAIRFLRDRLPNRVVDCAAGDALALDNPNAPS